MARLILQVAADHPTAPGHFPGNPILPGALLLAEAVRMIEAAAGAHFSSCKIKNAKFLHPVRPGDCVWIDYEITDRGGIEFHCAIGERRVLSGSLSATQDA